MEKPKKKNRQNKDSEAGNELVNNGSIIQKEILCMGNGINFSGKRIGFFVFSAYRAVLFAGLFGILLFIGIFGPSLWRFYFGAGNVFVYQAGSLAVHYLDIGQGKCIAVQFPDGRVAVMDSGEDMYYNRIKTYLETRILGSNGRIDFLIATHSHSDHVGGLTRLLQDFDVGIVYRPLNKSLNDPEADDAIGAAVDTEVYDNFINSAYRHAEEVRFIIAGAEITDGKQSFSWIFHTPTLEYAERLSSSFDDINAVSSVVTLKYLNHIFVFTADATAKTELQFTQSASVSALNFAEAAVYLDVGHHGSRVSSSAVFLEFIKPDKAVISLGAKNLYGFPHDEVISRLENAGIEDKDLMLTSELGNITVTVGAGGEHIYFAFDNEPDLSLLWVLAAVTIFALCFVNFGKVEPAESESLYKKE